MTATAGRPSGRRHSDGDHLIPRAVERWWPLGPVVLAAVLIGLATVLDRGDAGQRDAALLVGSFALYFLLPLALVILLVFLVQRHRAQRPGSPFRM